MNTPAVPTTPLRRRIAEREQPRKPEPFVPPWRKRLTARDESGRVLLP